MATIRPMRDKWQAIIRRKGYPSQSQTFDLRKDAEKWARQQERLIDTGEWADRTEAHQTTLGELLGRYGKEVTPTKRGCYAESCRVDAFRRSLLAKYSIAGITSQLVAKWRDQRLTEVSGSTVAKELNLLGHVFSVATREWGFVLQSNPVRLVKKPAEAEPRNRILCDTQRAKLIATCAQCRNPWIKPVVVFALETAARRGEILSLTWNAVDLARNTAKVNGKTGSRSVPLSTACVFMLKSLPRSLDGKVFPVTIEALKQAYARAVVRAGINDFTFHDLRHDALTRLAKMGFNVLELRAISGHTTATMLQRYVSIDAEELAAKLNLELCQPVLPVCLAV